MDAIKNAIGGNKSSSTTGQTTSNQQPATGQQDYGDKGKASHLPTCLIHSPGHDTRTH